MLDPDKQVQQTLRFFFETFSRAGSAMATIKTFRQQGLLFPLSSLNREQIDRSIGDLLIQTMTPMALDLTLTVQQEIQVRLDEVDRMRSKQVERARYEADLAQRRYMHARILPTVWWTTRWRRNGTANCVR